MPRSHVSTAVTAAAAFGAVLASYAALRPIRDALVLDGDPDRISWLFSATFAAMLVLAPLWAKLVGRGPRRVVPFAFHGFALCALGFAALVHARVAPVAIGRVFYVWAAVFNLFVVSVFWSLLADLVGPSVARRAYGPIAAGGTIGGIAGPLLTKALVDTIGVAGILCVSAALLELAALGVIALRALAGDDVEHSSDAPIAAGAWASLAHVAKRPQLRALVGYVLCTACAATFVYLAKAHIGHDLVPDRTARTELFASIDMWTNIAVLVVQLAIAGPLLARFGPGIALCVLPLVQAAGIATLAFAPSVTALVAVAIAGGAATHGLTRPARELLFTVMTRDDKYRAKNAIDTVGYRFGDVGSVWLGALLGATGAAFASIPLVVAWLVLAGSLGSGFREEAA